MRFASRAERIEPFYVMEVAKAAADVHTWIFHQKAQAVTVNGTDSG
mgnify:CR=1 FL=1